MENGIVKNWDDMGHVWDYTFGPEKMDIDPKVCLYFLLLSFMTGLLDIYPHVADIGATAM